MTNDPRIPVISAADAHYLRAIRVRLEQLYSEHPNDARLREQLSDEVSWIDGQFEGHLPKANDRAETNSITEDWLASAGFKWHQLDRQPDKHWLLWLGDATRERHSFTSWEDIGIEVAPCGWKNADAGTWFCWFRSDSAGRYHRFIHIRHLRTTGDLVRLIEAITGQDWNPTNNLYGSMRKPEDAARIRQESQRIDRRLMESPHKWADIENDDTRGRALPDHVTAAIKGGGAK